MGKWLPGDERGSIDRFNNGFGTPRNPSNIIREQQCAFKLKSEPFVMNARARMIVLEAIKETCAVRNWTYFALNVRTNHAHAVVEAVASSDKMLGDLKAYATRKLRAGGCWTYEHSPWVDKGSKRKLWNENHISAAVDYVLYGQGDELPEFD
jgi:REP element-mobilizing transposase RayT